MEDQEIQFERYKIAVEQVRYEGKLGWDNFRTFLIAHTIFIGFLLKGAFESQDIYSIESFCVSLIGIWLCIAWWATKERNHAYYIFRMAQARELEPDGWNYFKGKGQKFSDGESVKIEKKPYQIHKLGRKLRKPAATKSILGAFFFAYLYIAIVSFINIDLVDIQILEIIPIALALLGTFFITFALKELKNKKNLIAPSFVCQRPCLIIIGLTMIIISACIQLAIVMWK